MADLVLVRPRHGRNRCDHTEPSRSPTFKQQQPRGPAAPAFSMTECEFLLPEQDEDWVLR